MCRKKRGRQTVFIKKYERKLAKTLVFAEKSTNFVNMS